MVILSFKEEKEICVEPRQIFHQAKHLQAMYKRCMWNRSSESNFY